MVVRHRGSSRGGWLMRLGVWLCTAILLQGVVDTETLAQEKEGEPEAATDEVAKEAVELFRRMMKGDETQGLAAVERISPVRHRLVAEELGKCLRTNDEKFQLAVVEALARQDGKHAARPLLSALKARPNADRHAVRGAILESLGEVGSRQAVPLMVETLKSETEHPLVIKGAVVALGILDETRALDELIKMFEEDPNRQPENPGTNDPPASYWKRIWERWKVVEAPLRATLEQLTEQKFADGKEAREWYEKNRRRLRRR